MSDARIHKVDIIGTIAYTPERATFLDFSAPFMNSPMAIFVHKGDPSFHDYGDLGRARIAVARGGVGYGYVLRHHFDQHLTLADSLSDSLVLLDQGKENALIIHTWTV